MIRPDNYVSSMQVLPALLQPVNDG